MGNLRAKLEAFFDLELKLKMYPPGRGRRRRGGGVPGGVVAGGVVPVAAAGPPRSVGRDPAAVDGVGVAGIHGKAFTSFHHVSHGARNSSFLQHLWGFPSISYSSSVLLSLCAFVLLHEREREINRLLQLTRFGD